jgi:hypothetical protein
VASLGGMVAGVDHGGRKKDFAEVRERKKWWLFQEWGWSACGWASYLWWSRWWLERWGERGREKLQKRGQRGWFFADFGPNFLLPQARKSTSIYRRWKRAILFIPGKNFSPWFSW